jgi:hypothetical protein
MKKGILAICLLMFARLLCPHTIKEVRIPKDINIEEGVFKATFIRNLSDAEIYQFTEISIVDDLIYIGSDKQQELFCFNLQGELKAKISSKGQGPGSFSICMGLKPYESNIAFMSPFNFKIVILNKELEFIKQLILKRSYMSFVANKDNEFICNTMGSFSENYFDVYDENGKFKRSFGKMQTTSAEKRKIRSFDSVGATVYTPEKDGLWARFRNRYDLQYYEREKLVIEIKEKKGYFKAVEKEVMGRKYISYVDRGFYLVRLKDKLYYFYSKDKEIFSDIFDIHTCKLLRRIKYKKGYSKIAHHINNVFYAIKYNEDYEVELYKLEMEEAMEAKSPKALASRY